ncbi:hypothetical protein N8T08_005678 [Aspergillus melleus]|uniref:Uncharacterized protein n=1 Tax=Aspergillus melleus TaxID=138277 RepID=A0ACC3B1Q3_9EURO|nr:hypothetical protein N8T08_005678 [Aspergillus melleus]
MAQTTKEATADRLAPLRTPQSNELAALYHIAMHDARGLSKTSCGPGILGIRDIRAVFGASPEVATLGMSMFVVGFAPGAAVVGAFERDLWKADCVCLDICWADGV